jgi:hypothetical protein
MRTGSSPRTNDFKGKSTEGPVRKDPPGNGRKPRLHDANTPSRQAVSTLKPCLHRRSRHFLGSTEGNCCFRLICHCRRAGKTPRALGNHLLVPTHRGRTLRNHPPVPIGPSRPFGNQRLVPNPAPRPFGNQPSVPNPADEPFGNHRLVPTSERNLIGNHPVVPTRSRAF